MNYRQLGSTGIKVSAIGMGCWGVGSEAYGKVETRTALQTISEALRQGINFFDTADIYGSGRSEELLGCFLSQNPRDQMVIATKVGSRPHTGKEMPVALDPVHIRTSLEDSLYRLQTNYIDLYQLHSPPLPLVEQAIDELYMLKCEGAIRAIGVSAKSPEDALKIIEDPRVDVVQVNYNMIDQRARENGLLDLCKERGIGVIARTPLAFGFLTGQYAKGAKFQAPDHRSHWTQAQIDIWAEAHEKFMWLEVCAGLKPVEQALGFCLAHPAIATVIPGMLTPQQVVENTIWANVVGTKMYGDELSFIEKVYNDNSFFIED